jgi:hypothetical protein
VTEPSEPAPAIVEWGTERPRLSDRWGRLGSWQLAIPAVLTGLGALALFGSLVGEWQVVQEVSGSEQVTIRIGSVLVWGVWWLVGGMLLASCGGLSLLGPFPLRPYTRAFGLVLAAVLLGMLVAATWELGEESVIVSAVDGFEISLGRGIYAAFASVVLFGSALVLAGGRVVGTAPDRPDPDPSSSYAGPADLTVGPAEPLTRFGEGRERR